MKHTVILSDVHLSQAQPEDPHDPLCFRYRTRAFHPDTAFAALVDELLARHGDDEIELVFNGDVFDFDAPAVKDGAIARDEVPLDDAGSAEHARRIVTDHATWFGAVARLLVRGHRLLVTSGNHDVELYWPGARAAIRDELAQLCADEAARAGVVVPDVTERVRFRTWFHVTDDRVYVEHGSQYDFFNGWRFAMLPLTRERTHIHPNLGKLAFRRTGSRMAYMNPYYEESFYISPVRTVIEFLRRYAFSRHHIARTWLFGALRTLVDIAKHRHREDRTREAHALAREETGATERAIAETHALGALPAEDNMLAIARELWIDRVLFIAFAVLSLVVSAVFAGLLVTAILFGALALVFGAYEMLMPKPDIRTYDSAPPEVRRILDIHGVRAMCLGHTHRPFGIWEDARFYGNSGSWCPAFKDLACTQPILDGRPFLWLTTEGDRIWGGLHWWRDGAVVPEPGATRAREANDEPALLAS